MALPRGLFHPKFSTHHRATVNSAGLARVQIYTVSEYGTWTPDGTGDDTTELLYVGRARWQTVARPNNRDFVEDQAKLQLVRVAIGFEDNEVSSDLLQLPEIPVNAVVQCIANPADPSLVGTRVHVHGWSNSSNAWQRVFMCQENKKQG